ncbi:aldolase [Rickenella mellea]|uniref:Aldolase n=1 Tax=Rickenella mellea TaxID=50990 RepID=A0A4Y7PXZ6_9AGAM|nr:aldolase [Rickenella mellea]
MASPPLNALSTLRASGTTIASDTAEYLQIAPFDPIDATTNPSLLYAAVSQPSYAHLVERAVEFAVGRSTADRAEVETGKERGRIDSVVELAVDRLIVEVGYQILQIIPGQVSISLDPRIAYDTNTMVRKGVQLASLMEELGVPTSRYLIKIPATHTGIQAAQILQSPPHNLRVNMTLIFGVVQAKACAEAGVSVVSPFVGRIMDWHLAQSDRTNPYPITSHPGVLTVRAISDIYRQKGYKTRIMAAGFRTLDEIFALSDLNIVMTLPPSLLTKLQNSPPRPSFPFATETDERTNGNSVSFTNGNGGGTFRANGTEHRGEPLTNGKNINAHHLNGSYASPSSPSPTFPKQSLLDPQTYHAALSAERIALEKVPEGLKKFSEDAERLEALVRESVIRRLGK